jgi:hypothetical protein
VQHWLGECTDIDPFLHWFSATDLLLATMMNAESALDKESPI